MFSSSKIARVICVLAFTLYTVQAGWFGSDEEKPRRSRGQRADPTPNADTVEPYDPAYEQNAGDQNESSEQQQ